MQQEISAPCENKLYKIASTILYLIIPFTFVINPYLFTFAVVMQLLLLFVLRLSFSELFITLLLNGFLYSCISVIGIRLYDLIILISFMYLAITKNINLKLSMRMTFLLLGILFTFFIHSTNLNTFLEVVRYIFSALLFIVVLNAKPDVNKIDGIIIKIGFANLFNAIAVFLLISLGKFTNYSNSLISTNAYIFQGEVRLNGFFSDPNKYMTFSLVMMFIIEYFIQDKNKRRLGIFLFSLASFLSMSRTVIISLALFIFLKGLIVLKKKSFRGFVILITLFIIIIIALTCFDLVNDIISWMYQFVGKLLGRYKSSGDINSLKNNGRIYIWKMAIGQIEDKPIFGHGWLSCHSLLPYPTHNTFLSLLLDGGLFILVFFICTFSPLLFNKRFELTIPCIIVPMMFLDLGNYRLLFLLLALILNQKNSYKSKIEKTIDSLNITENNFNQ